MSTIEAAASQPAAVAAKSDVSVIKPAGVAPVRPKTSAVSTDQVANLLSRNPEKFVVERQITPVPGQPAPEAPTATEAEKQPTEQQTEANAAESAQSEQAPAEQAQAGEAKAGEDDDLSQLEQYDDKTKQAVRAELERYKQKQQAKIDKRIGKEVAKTKTLDEQVQTLQQQLEELRKAQVPANEPVPVANPGNPLGHIQDIDKLNQEFVQAKQTVRIAEDLLDQAVDNNLNEVQYEGQTYTKQQLRAAVKNARRVVDEHVPAQMRFLQARQQAEQAAATEFPWLNDRGSKEYGLFQAALKQRPWLASDPEHKLMVAMWVEGYKTVEARKASAAQPQKPTPPPKPRAPNGQFDVAASSGATRAPDETLQRKAAAEELSAMLKSKKGVSAKDTAAILLKRAVIQR